MTDEQRETPTPSPPPKNEPTPPLTSAEAGGSDQPAASPTTLADAVAAAKAVEELVTKLYDDLEARVRTIEAHLRARGFTA